MLFETRRSGLRLVYETEGSGNPPLLFVHGWGGDRAHFAPQMAHFAEQHRVAAIDLRGHGESDRPPAETGNYSVATFANDALFVLQAAGIARPVVVGHGLGGLVALACAARADTVAAAVLINPALALDAASKASYAAAPAALRGDAAAAWRSQFVAGLFLPGETEGREAIEQGLNQGSASVAAAIWQNLADFAGEAALAAAQVPVLVIDSANIEAPLHAACPSIVVEQTPQVGHFNQLYAAAAVNAAIERFLAAHAPTQET